MKELSYYLPEIILIVLVTLTIGWGILFVRDLIRRSNGSVTCLHCKGACEKISRQPYLFLLSASFGERYEDAEHWLPAHMRPISTKEEIPTGRRACWVELYRCPQCNTRQVILTDFLQVRGKEYEKGSYVLPYEPFYSLIEEWKNYKNRRNLL